MKKKLSIQIGFLLPLILPFILCVGGRNVDLHSENVDPSDSVFQLKLREIESIIVDFANISSQYKTVNNDRLFLMDEVLKLKNSENQLNDAAQKLLKDFQSNNIPDSIPEFSQFSDATKKIKRSIFDINQLERDRDSLIKDISKVDSIAELSRSKQINSLKKKISQKDSSLFFLIFDAMGAFHDTISTKKKIDDLINNLKRKEKEKQSNSRILSTKNQNLELLNTNFKELSSAYKTISRRSDQVYKNFEDILFKNSAHSSYKIKFMNADYRVFITDLDSHVVRIHSNQQRLVPLKTIWNKLISEKREPLMVVNGGMYNFDGSSVGLYINDSKLVKDLERTTIQIKDNFHLYPNGVFYIDSLGRFNVMQTSDFAKKTKKQLKQITYATQSGPMLVVNDSIHPAFNFKSQNFNIRNGVGVIDGYASKKGVFIISDTPVSFYQFALLFKYIFNTKNALYLDGAISKMYSDEGGRKMGDLDGQLGPIVSISKH